MNAMMIRSAALFLAGIALAAPAIAQDKPPLHSTLARLELSMEIATIDDNGYPSALRITIKNVGGVPVDMPVLKGACNPENGVRVGATWIADDSIGNGIGSGGGCGGEGASLIERLRWWVRLRPSESMTTTERADWSAYGKDGPGTVEYWIEYIPPSLSEKEFVSLANEGYQVPTQTLETPHSSFHMH
jgi:hypothetical protein